ncbi:hypothetical protein EV121DRAFT_297549 [Schizophyllum commune]
MSPYVLQDVCHSPNLPPAGTQSQRAISSDPTSTRMTLRRPRNALEARNPTLANPTSWIHVQTAQTPQNLPAYIYSSCNISSFLRMHIDAWLLFSFCLIPSLVAGHSFGGDWYRNLGDSGARASSIARPVQPGRACCARARPRLQATLPLDFKRSIPHLQPTSPLAFKRLIASPSAHTIPHHPDQMTLQSYCGDYLSGDMRVVGLTATRASSALPRPHRHSSDRTAILPIVPTDAADARDSTDAADDARYTADTADAANARDPTDAADARDPTDAADTCCLADARTT